MLSHFTMLAVKVSVFLAFTILAVLHAGDAQTPPLQLLEIGSGYYYFGQNVSSWFGAALFCRSYAMELVTFETQQELTLVGNEIVKQGLASGSGIWTSGSDAAVEGQWFWSQTGQPINYSAWMAGEPNNVNNNEHYMVAFNINGALKWDDRNGKGLSKFVCEVPAACHFK